jgi:hypothetical protein
MMIAPPSVCAVTSYIASAGGVLAPTSRRSVCRGGEPAPVPILCRLPAVGTVGP